ncbi:MAG: hypothetical protein WAM16_03855 [Nitrososphaeraceae archaeon]
MFAQQTLDLKAPGGNEAFGGEQKGTELIVSNEHSVNIVANMTTPPKEGTVFEGWLADVGVRTINQVLENSQRMEHLITQGQW